MRFRSCHRGPFPGQVRIPPQQVPRNPIHFTSLRREKSCFHLVFLRLLILVSQYALFDHRSANFNLSCHLMLVKVRVRVTIFLKWHVILRQRCLPRLSAPRSEGTAAVVMANIETWRCKRHELEVRIVDGHAELPDGMVDEDGKLSFACATSGTRSRPYSRCFILSRCANFWIASVPDLPQAIPPYWVPI